MFGHVFVFENDPPPEGFDVAITCQTQMASFFFAGHPLSFLLSLLISTSSLQFVPFNVAFVSPLPLLKNTAVLSAGLGRA